MFKRTDKKEKFLHFLAIGSLSLAVAAGTSFIMAHVTHAPVDWKPDILLACATGMTSFVYLTIIGLQENFFGIRKDEQEDAKKFVLNLNKMATGEITPEQFKKNLAGHKHFLKKLNVDLDDLVKLHNNVNPKDLNELVNFHLEASTKTPPKLTI